MSANNVKKVVSSWFNGKENYININCVQDGSVFHNSMQNNIIIIPPIKYSKITA